MFLLRAFMSLGILSLTIASIPYRICVPEIWKDDCLEMLKVETASDLKLQCVAARDRGECLNFIQQRQADFTVVDPEDMYVASKLPNEDFYIFQEIRTIEERSAEFRYEAVMVVRNSLRISSLRDLRGLKSCHTGVNRNVGYKIPLTMLRKMDIIGPMNNHSMSPKENELAALTGMFEKSCIVGQWTPDPSTTASLKKKYSNLCALCEKPEVCEYPDNFSGYDGALRCLAHNGGDVAFTKVLFVRKFFGLPVGTTPASTTNENTDEFSYLCADGSKVSVKDKACSWAARPWQGYLGHQDLLVDMVNIREKINNLADIGRETKPGWWYTSLGLSKWADQPTNNVPIRMDEYLGKSNYSIVIERGHNEQSVRMCVTNDIEESKCQAMSRIAFSRDLRPILKCIKMASTKDCAIAVNEDAADVVVVPGDLVNSYAKSWSLVPLVSETYNNNSKKYAVAVVNKGSSINALNDLQGKRSCHMSATSFEGMTAPISALIAGGQMENKCYKLKYLINYFTQGSCIPDATDLINNPEGDDHSKLVKLCTLDGKMDPAQCDVTFLSSLDLASYDFSQSELLCLNKANGGRAALTEWADCNIALSPSQTWMGVPEQASRYSPTATQLLLGISDLFTTRKDLFSMFGQYLKYDNVLFNKDATGLIKADPEWFTKYAEITERSSKC